MAFKMKPFREKIKTIKTRTDVLNIIEVVRPTKAQL